MKKTVILCDFDLDGAGCCLVAKWSSPNQQYDIIPTNEDELSQHLKNSDPRIPLIVCDMTFNQKHVDIADRPNVLFVHHHDLPEKITSKNCKIISKQETSCTKLFADLLKTPLSDEKKKLIEYIDDYDSYNLKYKKSLFLNMVFWSFTGNKLEKFITAFEQGDRDFNDTEKNMVRIYASKMAEAVQNSEPHVLKTKNFNIIIFYADFAVNELCAEFCKKYDSDAAISINKNTLSACIRINRKKETNFDCGVFAKIFMDGHGYKNFASGKIIDKFVDLSIKFTKI